MKKTQAIEVMKRVCSMLQKCDCEIKLVNAETNETLEPDALAVKSGTLSGVIAGISLLKTDVPPEREDDLLTVVSEIVGNAGRAYLSEHLSKQSDGVDNG